MPRRKNPLATFVMFVAVLGFGWAAYHFVYEEQIFKSTEAAIPPAEKMNNVRNALEQSLADKDCFQSITLFEWHERQGYYRIDLTVLDGCRDEAKSIAARSLDVVRRASGGSDARIFIYILGQEVYHLVP